MVGMIGERTKEEALRPLVQQVCVPSGSSNSDSPSTKAFRPHLTSTALQRLSLIARRRQMARTSESTTGAMGITPKPSNAATKGHG